MTLSNGRPATRLMKRSSNPPKPTHISASTSKGLSSGFHPVAKTRCEEGVMAERTAEEVQKGMKEE